ncbi:MAG: hypothetical protein ACLTYW_07720 [Collinsella sp.]
MKLFHRGGPDHAAQVTHLRLENPRAASVLRVEVITARPVSATVPSKSNRHDRPFAYLHASIGILFPS